MGAGPGHIHRAIKALFAAEPDNAFTTAEICQRVYGVAVAEKKHRVAVMRTAKAMPELDYRVGENLGKQLVFYDPLNVMSYAMARLKADFLNKYANTYSRRTTSEADLRATLCDDRHRKLVAEGGSWWLHTEIRRAMARGDEKLAAKLAKQAQKRSAKIIARRRR